MPFDLVVRARRSLRADDARGSRVVARSTPATNDDDDGDVETILDHPFRRASRDLRTRRVVFAASIESRARACVVVVVAAAALLARRDIESIASDIPAPSPSPSPSPSPPRPRRPAGSSRRSPTSGATASTATTTG
jgi:hypothetical protein